jgi:hypothetical protein
MLACTKARDLSRLKADFGKSMFTIAHLRMCRVAGHQDEVPPPCLGGSDPQSGVSGSCRTAVGWIGHSGSTQHIQVNKRGILRMTST